MTRFIYPDSLTKYRLIEEKYNEDKNKRLGFRARKHRNQDRCKVWKWGCDSLYKEVHRKGSLCDLEREMQD